MQLNLKGTSKVVIVFCLILFFCEARILGSSNSINDLVNSLQENRDARENNRDSNDGIEDFTIVEAGNHETISSRSNRSLEELAGTLQHNEACSSDQFQCNNGNCIPRRYTCNKEDDCGDRSDETVGCTSVKEVIYLNEGDVVTIQHPAGGGLYGKNERFDWIIRNNGTMAAGFRIDVLSVWVEECCDKIEIRTEECHFGTSITSSGDGPFFIPTPEMNIRFTSDGQVSYYGFTINVQLTNEDFEETCPGNEAYLSLNEDQPSLTIKHPEHGRKYGNNEQYFWLISNEDPEAVGFKVTIEKMQIQTCCDKLMIEGDYCSYGPYTTRKPLSIQGRTMNVIWTSDGFGTDSGFVLNVTFLYNLDKADCHEYTCDEAGRCLRIHYDKELSWHDSVAACEAEEARLAVITDEGTNNLATSLYDADAKPPWIGISGNSVDNMTWITGEFINSYGLGQWRNDSSIIFGAKPIGCGVFYNNKWTIRRCSASRPYICERDKQN